MKTIMMLLFCAICFAGELNFMFYNVENLFDIYDDPKTRDGDFMPGGSKRYTYRAYDLKCRHLADVINHVDPDILGMVEVENREVLQDLSAYLKYSDQWEILIDAGQDIRGIDPALMYRKDRFEMIRCLYYPVFIQERGYHSRPVMRVDLMLKETGDTLSAFINHWSSRRGGKEMSDRFRLFAAEILLQAIYETIENHPSYLILITGDFNDDAHDQCLTYLSQTPDIRYLEKELPRNVHGTYYYDGEWIHFDHFLACNEKKAGSLHVKEARIVAPFWIRDKHTHGPFRFYNGVEILGGYSDHFPISLKLGFKRKSVE
jgi:predicted extracellular nuclease